MTKQARIRWLIIVTVSAGGGIRIRATLSRQAQDTSSDTTTSVDHWAARPQPSIVSFSHPELSWSRITFNNEQHVTTITQTLAVTERKPWLHHGEWNAPSLPRIMHDYGITLKHLEHRVYSYDEDNGLMVWNNDKSFIYYDPNTSSIFAAKIDDHLIHTKAPIVNDISSSRITKK